MRFGLSLQEATECLDSSDVETLDAIETASEIFEFQQGKLAIEIQFAKNPQSTYKHFSRKIIELRGDDPFAPDAEAVKETEKATREAVKAKGKKKLKAKKGTLLVRRNKPLLGSKPDGSKGTPDSSSARRRPI